MHLKLALLIISLFVTTACINIAGGDWKGHEESRVKSPDGMLDAVLVEGSAGATTGVTSLVFVVASDTKFGQKAAPFEFERAVFRADEVSDLSLSWLRPDFIEVRYRKARIFHFTNFTDVVSGAEGTRRRTEVGLVQLNPDSPSTRTNAGS